MLGRVRFRAWDLGGHEQVRSLWNEYFFETDAVIFMVDAADQDRFAEAREVRDCVGNARRAPNYVRRGG